MRQTLAIAVSFCLAVPVGAGAEETAADHFFQRLAGLCGQAFGGRLFDADAAAETALVGQSLVMHVRYCAEGEIRIPFHIGKNRSRTWVLSHTLGGLQLRHVHRHEDGSFDRVSSYGGYARGTGTATRQEFPADAFSKELFVGEDRAVSSQNVWVLEIIPGTRFVYELTRPEFKIRIEFDLSKTVSAPPAPWGSDGQ